MFAIRGVRLFIMQNINMYVQETSLVYIQSTHARIRFEISCRLLEISNTNSFLSFVYSYIL